jgi:hypothetical protein
MTDLHRFHNALRIMLNLDLADLEARGIRMTPREWSAFQADPFRFFIRADDPKAELLWRLIESRQPKAAPRLFGCYPANEVADLLDLLAKSADRGHAKSYAEIASLSRRGRDAIRHLLGQEVPNDE